MNSHLQQLITPLIALLLFICSAGCFAKSPEVDEIQYDFLIHGGRVVDGTGGAPYAADLLISGDEIVYIGPLDESSIRAERRVDAAGKVVTPGFIDSHAHGDPLISGLQESFVLQGVTSKVVGQDGRTPGYSQERGITIEDWRKSMKSPDIESEHPRSLLEWTHWVEEVGVAPNIATLVGFGSLRWMSGVGTGPAPTDEQFELMTEILTSEMDAGAYGLSSGLEYVPDMYSEESELVELAKVVGDKDGVVMSHMRTEDTGKLLTAIDELIAQGRQARVHAAHIKIVGSESREEAEAVMARIHGARFEGVEITADVYPYLAGMADMSLVYPLWAKQRSDFEHAARNNRQRLADAIYQRVMERHGPGRILVASGEQSGKTLEEVADNLSMPFVDVLIDGLHFRSASGQLSNTRRHLFVLELDSGEVRQITSGDWYVGARYSGIFFGGGFVWSPDGESIYFDGDVEFKDTLEHMNRSHIYKLETESGNIQQITESSGFWRTPHVSPD